MPNPQVIWAKQITIDKRTYLVRAVHLGAGKVEFERFNGKDAMDEGTWLDLDSIRGFSIEATTAVRDAFIGDAAVLMAKTPMIQQGD